MEKLSVSGAVMLAVIVLAYVFLVNNPRTRDKYAIPGFNVPQDVDWNTVKVISHPFPNKDSVEHTVTTGGKKFTIPPHQTVIVDFPVTDLPDGRRTLSCIVDDDASKELVVTFTQNTAEVKMGGEVLNIEINGTFTKDGVTRKLFEAPASSGSSSASVPTGSKKEFAFSFQNPDKHNPTFVTTSAGKFKVPAGKTCKVLTLVSPGQKIDNNIIVEFASGSTERWQIPINK